MSSPTPIPTSPRPRASTSSACRSTTGRSRPSSMWCRCNCWPTTPPWCAAPTSTSRATWRSRSLWNNLADTLRRDPVNLKKIGAVLALSALLAPAHAQTEIQWWHSMTGANNTGVSELAAKFNASQKDYKIVPIFKGQYPESMTAAIAAFRAGNPPHILQVFEVGTATMMSAKGAIKPVYLMMKEANVPFNTKDYLGPVAGYYTDSKGNMLSMPFNSSTPVFYINKDAFKKAGLDPEKAPKTWKEFAVAAGKLKASGQSCVYTTGWPSWVHIENFSAWHNLPIGTLENGIGGVKTEFKINSPQHVQHIQMLMDF